MTSLTSEQFGQLQTLAQTTHLTPLGVNSPVFDALVASGLDQLQQLVTEQFRSEGEILLQEALPGEALYIIRAGRVVVAKDIFNAPTILGVRGAGEVVGEMALIDGSPSSASVIVLEDAHLFRLSREDFKHLVHEQPSVAWGMLIALSGRLRESDNARRTEVFIGRQLAGQVTQLQTEQEQQRELQRLRDETSSFIVHDLRNPLNVIMGYINLLEISLAAADREKNGDILQIIHANIERLLRLVNELLESARLEAGDFPLQLTAVDLMPLCERLVKRLKLQQQNGLTINLRLDPQLPLLSADAELIDRVLTNLTDNALKYTPPDGRITLAAQLLPTGEMARISINDTGPGIPPQHRERIFERFVQVEGERLKRRGFGLGLLFCKLAIEAHKGRIWVEDGENQIGTQFVFTLPIAPS